MRISKLSGRRVARSALFAHTARIEDRRIEDRTRRIWFMASDERVVNKDLRCSNGAQSPLFSIALTRRHGGDRAPRLQQQRSCGDRCVPKRSLGTRIPLLSPVKSETRQSLPFAQTKEGLRIQAGVEVAVNAVAPIDSYRAAPGFLDQTHRQLQQGQCLKLQHRVSCRSAWWPDENGDNGVVVLIKYGDRSRPASGGARASTVLGSTESSIRFAKNSPQAN